MYCLKHLLLQLLHLSLPLLSPQACLDQRNPARVLASPGHIHDPATPPPPPTPTPTPPSKICASYLQHLLLQLLHLCLPLLGPLQGLGQRNPAVFLSNLTLKLLASTLLQEQQQWQQWQQQWESGC
jgi:hypothetical protein